jgi:hypothetical protein
MAANAGRPGLRVVVLPYPLETKPEKEVRSVARDNWRPFLRSVGL